MKKYKQIHVERLYCLTAQNNKVSPTAKLLCSCCQLVTPYEQ